MAALTKLPSEILLQILDNLSIRDCNTLLNIKKENVFESIYEDRISLPRYFSNNFGNGKEVIRILAETDAYLIGWNALFYAYKQFEVKDMDSIFCTKDNKPKWIFKLDDSELKLKHFMKQMESIGVVWYNIIDKFIHMTNKGYNFAISGYHTLALIELMKTTNQIKEVKQFMIEIVSKVSSIENDDWDYIMFIYNHSSETYNVIAIKLQDTDRNTRTLFHSLPTLSYKIEGHIVFNNTELPIEVLAPHDTPFSIFGTIVNIHTKVLGLCFITAFGFIHYFHNLLDRTDLYDVDISHHDICVTLTRYNVGLFNNTSLFIESESIENWPNKYWKTSQRRLCNVPDLRGNRFNDTVYKDYCLPGVPKYKYVSFRNSLLNKCNSNINLKAYILSQWEPLDYSFGIIPNPWIH